MAEMAARAALGRARITAIQDNTTVKLRAESADNFVDASELARWHRRATALHGELQHWPGCVELTLPAHPDATTAPEADPDGEGRHDDGPDL